jgi:tetratricopeptide (TPR) repeat protein
MVLVLCCNAVWLMAQTSIPDTPEQRRERAMALEQTMKNQGTSAQLRELAMIYAVIAGLDDAQPATTQKAIGILEEAVKSNPDDAELTAAYGSVLTMLARFETSTAKQLHYVKKGFRMMDRAIKNDPTNIGALLQRANNSLNTPPFLQRTHFAKKDFQQVLDLVGDSRGPGFKAMILFNLGQAHEVLQDTEQARNYWRDAVKLKVPVWSDKAAVKLNS